MPVNIPENKKLLVVSDTSMVKDSNGYVNAFGPVVVELNNLLLEFDEITWIGFNRKNELNNKSFIKINDNKIKPILLKGVGGKTFLDKLNIIFAYPKMALIILKHISKHTYIHSRAPSNPSIIVMFYSLFFSKKIFWHKYAGTWVEKASFFYKLQRLFLSNLKMNSVITINGNFSEKKNILPFENPCLDTVDRDLGAQIVENKNLKNKINFCFVGALTSKKGVNDIISAFKNIKSSKIGEIHFVGDGPCLEKYIEESKDIKYKLFFHGYLAKKQIKDIYIKSHFILLPSQSEGFPKVIGEAMNYGTIPIVSNISCIDQYIQNNKNGYLLEKPFGISLINKIEESLKLEEKTFLNWIKFNYKLSEKFTYTYYNKRIKKEIFNIE
ncbi:glycosyltransferase [Polaribacter aestuariivivens]|uniref:Glycosyltransferase n=1 Tax=Polaribacter aestuariivivens TaxID=2304626 RepID=A0A5S3N7H0_9FLAO|nr:glycosyltransferase [Polaribacter aestuariivivens]TMM31338.1 glycosyltransferase [Polaribacter aestuariivivens]